MAFGAGAAVFGIVGLLRAVDLAAETNSAASGVLATLYSLISLSGVVVASAGFLALWVFLMRQGGANTEHAS